MVTVSVTMLHCAKKIMKSAANTHRQAECAILLLLLLLKLKDKSDTMRERCRGTLHSQCSDMIHYP